MPLQQSQWTSADGLACASQVRLVEKPALELELTGTTLHFVFGPVAAASWLWCTIILLNLSRIKHAPHKGHIYMLMQRQHGAGGGWD